MKEYVIDSMYRLNQNTLNFEKRDLNNTSLIAFSTWEEADLHKIKRSDRFIVFNDDEPDVCFNELNQIVITYGNKQIDEKEFSNIIDKKPNYIVSDDLMVYPEGFYVRKQNHNLTDCGPFKYLLVLKEVMCIDTTSASPPNNKQVQTKSPINQTKEKEVAKTTMNSKEKYLLDSERKIYSFDNNDEIPENSIVIGYYDDDSADDEGHGFRDIIVSWFDDQEYCEYRSLKDIDGDFHVGEIINDDDERISSEQKHYSPGYFIENLSGEVEGPFDFAMILELDTGKSKSNPSKNKNNTPKVKEAKTMAAVNVTDSFKQVMSMRMLEKIMSGNKDIDIGKLYLMQSIMTGEKLEMTDVIKSKLISQFDLDKNKEDLPIEKLLILQSLESGSLDIGQLIQMKMIGKLLDEDNDRDDKKEKSKSSDK